VENEIIAIAPAPVGDTAATAYLLLFNDQILTLQPDGQTELLAQTPSSSLDLLAVTHPSQNRTWLLLAHEDGLWAYKNN
jgi:hypothetical protein